MGPNVHPGSAAALEKLRMAALAKHRAKHLKAGLYVMS
jgi:hypothetical protein